MQLQILFPRKNETISFFTDVQRKFVEGDLAYRLSIVDRTLQYEKLYGEGLDRSASAPLFMAWTAEAGAEYYRAEFIRRDGNVLVRRTEETSIRMPYLHTACAYVCRVTAYRGREVIGVSEDVPFTTADEQPRFVYAPNVSNVRDIGGWKTTDGRRVAQGMMFRGTELEPNFHLTEEGKRIMVEELCLRSDFDLRGGGGTSEEGVLAPFGVKRIYAPFGAYRGVVVPDVCEEQRRQAACDIFRLLCDPSIYPLYFHCWAGADRTGTMAYLLLGFLGVPEENAVLDYEATTLSVWGERSRNYPLFADMRGALRRVYGVDGADLQTQVRRFFLDIGLTEEELKILSDTLLTDE